MTFPPKKKGAKKGPPKKFAKPGSQASSKQAPLKRGMPMQVPGMLGSMVPR